MVVGRTKFGPFLHARFLRVRARFDRYATSAPMVTPASATRIIAFAICVLQAAARTWAPAGGFENSTGASGCVVKLIRQSLPNVCFGASPCEMVCPKGRGKFDCEDHRSVTVTAGCQGLFQCSNGATTLCHSNGASAQRCECTGSLEGQSSKGFALPSPCHLNPYTKAMGICPPAIPLPPMPPPSPREPSSLPSWSPSTHHPPIFDTTGVLLIRTPPPPLPPPSPPSLPHGPSRLRPSPRSPSHPPSPPCSGLPPSPTPPASTQERGSTLHSVCSPACARAFHGCVKANGAAGWVQCVNEFAHVVGALRDAGCVAGCEMPNAHGSGSASNTSARVEG